MDNKMLSQKGRSKKKLLLETSFRLFIQRGLNEVSLDDILTESGVKKGNFYHYFKSKDQLILESFIECYQMPLDEWIESVFKMKMGAREAIEYYFYNTSTHMLNLWHEITKEYSLRSQDIYLVTIEGIRKFGYFSDHYQKYGDRIQGWIQGLLEEEQENHQISSKINCQELAAFIFSSCEGVYYSWLMNPSISFHDMMKNNLNFIWSYVEFESSGKKNGTRNE